MNWSKLKLLLVIVLVFCTLMVFVGCNKTSSEDDYNITDMEAESVERTKDQASEAIKEGETNIVVEPIIDEMNTKELPHYNENGVWYEIFVRAFADSDGDGIGDFTGLINKLDYLNDGDDLTEDDLGINGIWLMPINPSPSYHGYDVTDYYDVNPEYGNLDQFKQLLEEAHARNIKVIMDLVLNHSSSQHPWFIDALENEDSVYRDYYRFQTNDNESINFQKQVWGHNVWIPTGDDYYYAIFWDQMPDLNYDTEALRNEMIDVATFWLEMGVDGFRVDAVSHIFGSGELEKGVEYDPLIDAWWTEFNSALRDVNPNYYLVGEAWEPVKARAEYAEYFDTTFDFDLAEAGLLTMVKNEVDFDVENNGLMIEIEKIQESLDEINLDFINGIFLTNHDMRRAMDYLNGDEVDMKLASLMYMTLPGNPFIYYGEEIGMLGGKPDEIIREPFIWGDEAQTSWETLEANTETMSVLMQDRVPDSLLNHYREIIRLRQDNEALLKGDFIGIETTSMKIIAYKRTTDNQKLIVVHNLSSIEQETSVEELFDGLDVELLYFQPLKADISGEKITIPAKTTLIYELHP